jgi:ribosomal protein S18 acetylase RimI-like enzyme
MATFPDLPGFILRPFSLDDLPAFVDLGLPTCAFMHGRPDVGEDVMRKRFTSFVKDHAFETDSTIFLVVTPNDRLAGQIWFRKTVNRFNGLRELWVWDLTVDPEFRGRGLGRALLQFAKDSAAEFGDAELWLLVSSRNTRAMNMYGQAGMRSAGQLMVASMSLVPDSDDEIKVNQSVIRPLCSSDVKSLHKLWKAAGLPFRPAGRDREDRLARHLSGPTTGGWGAFVSDLMVAATLTSNDGRKGWIERLATLPEFRKAGLAKAILTAAVRTLKESGALVIAALIEEENVPSRRLFESVGFVHSPTLCYYSLRDDSGC